MVPNSLCKALLGCLALLHLIGLGISGVPSRSNRKRWFFTDCDRSMLNLCCKAVRVLPGFDHQKLYSKLSLMQKGYRYIHSKGQGLKCLDFVFFGLRKGEMIPNDY